jgi:hypothetical protein
VDLGDSGRCDSRERRLESVVVLGRETDHDISRQVEALCLRDPAKVGLDVVASPHLAEDTVVARLQGHMEVPGNGGHLPQGGD